MLLSRPFQVGNIIFGAIYTFEFAGDVFPLHTHTDADNHTTTLLYGSMQCTGHAKYEGTVLSAKPGGTIVNWVAGEPHGFTALEDGTTIMNLFKKPTILPDET